MLKRLVAGFLLADRVLVAVGGPSLLNLARKYVPKRFPYIGAVLTWLMSKLGRGPSLPRVTNTVWKKVQID